MRRRIRPLRVLLAVLFILSLLLNAAFVGIAVRISGTIAAPGGGLARSLVDMPPSLRRSFLDALAEEREELAQLRESLAVRRDAFIDALTAEPYDRAAAERAAAAVRSATRDLQLEAQRILFRTAEGLDRAPEMPPNEQ